MLQHLYKQMVSFLSDFYELNALLEMRSYDCKNRIHSFLFNVKNTKCDHFSFPFVSKIPLRYLHATTRQMKMGENVYFGGVCWLPIENRTCELI